jgi:hypothetical protein
MSIHQTIERLTARPRRLAVSWVTIAVFAIVIAYVDGFWVTSLQGAVGAIERNQPPFTRWLHDSTLMLPLYFVAVLAAMLIARRWVGHNRGTLVKLGATALLITVISAGVGIAEVAASSAYDYRLQSRDLATVQKIHFLDHVHPVAVQPGSAVLPAASTCSGLCAARRATLLVHVRAVKYASAMLLITNLVLVAWLLALRSDRLWRPRQAAVRHRAAMIW